MHAPTYVSKYYVILYNLIGLDYQIHVQYIKVSIN